MRVRLVALALGLIAGESLLGAPAARAIAIGLQNDGGIITQLDLSPNPADGSLPISTSGTLFGFDYSINVTGSADIHDPTLISTVNLRRSSPDFSGFLTVYVVQLNRTFPAGNNTLVSDFRSNNQSALGVDGITYNSSANEIFTSVGQGRDFQLGFSGVFHPATGLQSSQDIGTLFSLSPVNHFFETEVFEVNTEFNIGQTADVTISLGFQSSPTTPAAVPEPTSLVLLGSALAALGVVRRRRFQS